MRRIHTEPPRREEMGRVAVAIGGSLSQRHVGLLFRAGTENIQFLHLGWHHRLFCDDPDPNFAWLMCPSFGEEEGNMFATWMQSIYSANQGDMPYGLNYALGSHFDSLGKFIPSDDGEGLTCATFVMALFRSFGFDAVEEQTWPNRESDRIFHELIVEKLEQTWFVDQQHITAQKKHIGIAARYKPEEIAAALNVYDDDPIAFGEAELLGKAIVNILWACGKIN